MRWPNLVFIALTQFLFVYCIQVPIFEDHNIQAVVKGTNFILLCLSSVLIAAAGYIINDYFDLNIDLVNKPEKMVVAKIIRRRWTIVWHVILSITGIAIGFYLDFTTRIFFLGAANVICVVVLFFYSVSLKRKLLSGNILISLLTAWVILVVTWCEMSRLEEAEVSLVTARILRLTFLYAGFAFIISLIREVVKDMEDIEGDRKYGCTTMPIAWGMNAAKVFVAVWLAVLIALLVIVQFYVLQFNWWFSAIYCIVFIIVPLIWILRKLFKAAVPADFHRLSSVIKLVMFTGILSMVFFKLYH